MNDVERALIEDRIAQDTAWCYPHGLQGERIEATVEYAVGELSVPACRACFVRAREDGIAIDSSVPVAPPPYVTLLRRLMAGHD